MNSFQLKPDRSTNGRPLAGTWTWHCASLPAKAGHHLGWRGPLVFPGDEKFVPHDPEHVGHVWIVIGVIIRRPSGVAGFTEGGKQWF